MSQVDALSELRAAIPDTGVVWVATSSDETETESASATLPRPYTAAMLIDSLDQIPELSNTTKTSHEQRQEGKLCTT